MFFLAALVWVALWASAMALPSGAPNCLTNQAAPQAYHVVDEEGRVRQTGSLRKYGLDLFIDGVIVEPNAIGTLVANQTHEIKVQGRNSAAERAKYRGALVLMHHDSVDMSAGLLPLTSFQSAPGCRGSTVAGVTQTSNSYKDGSSTPVALLKWDTALSNIKLDVNVVVANNWTNSIYFYTQFVLESVAPLEVGATSAPVQPTTPRPTMSQPVTVSKAPIAAPTTTGSTPCGLLRWGLVCPRTKCGWLGTLLGLCSRDE